MLIGYTVTNMTFALKGEYKDWCSYSLSSTSMGKRKDISSLVFGKVEALLATGLLSVREIAIQCGIHHSSVINIKKRIAANGPLASRIGKCGRKRKTTAQDDRSMVRMIRQEPLLSAKQVRGELVRRGINVSIRTVQRRLPELGCRSVKPVRKPKLTQTMKGKRLQFARQYVTKPVEFWRTVCFSDESTFECQATSKRQVWQTPGYPTPVRETVKHPIKVMV